MKSLKRLLRLPTASSLRTQLMLTTVAPVATLLFALSLVGIFGFNRLTQTLVEERDSELVQLATQQVASYWHDSVLLLAGASSNDTVRNGNAVAIQDYLSANVALWQRFDRVSVTNARGVVIATVGGEIGEDVSELDYFDRVRQARRPIRSSVHQDIHGFQVIVVAVPIYSLRGQFSGCVMGVWELRGQALGQPIANLRVGEDGFAFLVNEEGMVLYHPSRDFIGGDFRQHPAVAALLRGETGSQTVSVRGERTVLGYAPLHLRQLTSSVVADESWDGWGLLTSERWDDITAPLRPYVNLIVVLLVLVFALPMAFLAMSSRRIAAPLQSFAKQAERIASGEFTPVSIRSGLREVRDLERAFNIMVDQLGKYRNDIQNYVVSILNSQEQERKRVARELHDETAQALVVLGRRIELAEELSDSVELTNELENLRDMVDDTLQGVRRFTSDLRPPLLEELGLPRTLELLGSRVEREGSIRVDVSINGTPRQLLPELDLGLYRLAQESLSNVRKHAHATHATVELTYGPDAVTLKIADDGVGFEAPDDLTDLMKSGRLGLMGIHERARLFGGKARITSNPGEGTAVIIDIPLTSIVLPAEPSETRNGPNGQ